jgi:hypothetical protein
MVGKNGDMGKNGDIVGKNGDIALFDSCPTGGKNGDIV